MPGERRQGVRFQGDELQQPALALAAQLEQALAGALQRRRVAGEHRIAAVHEQRLAQRRQRLLAPELDQGGDDVLQRLQLAGLGGIHGGLDQLRTHVVSQRPPQYPP